MSVKTSVMWGKYAPKMKRLAARRRRLIAALVAAGVFGPENRGTVESRSTAGEAIQVPYRDGVQFVLTVKGLEQVCRQNGVKVLR